jgi:ABC-type Fe3+-hydroxamate transport system substrate-binding protein
MGRAVEIPQPVRRIVSLVPSQTELLVDLGLKNLLVGVTQFCVHPGDLRKAIPQVGGTKAVKTDQLPALKPDLVIGNKEENLRSDIEAIERHVPVWMSNIADVESALEMIRNIGELTGTVEAANEMANNIKFNFSRLKDQIEAFKPLKALYLIWKKPYMAAGKGTFIDDCLSYCGLVNCLEETRYPHVNLSAIDPEVILLSSEPYPFSEQHIAELQSLFPKAAVCLADGEYFSWYGSRMLGAPAYFKTLIDHLHAHQ